MDWSRRFSLRKRVALLLVLDTLFENNTMMSNNGSMDMGTMMLGLVGMFMLFTVAVGMFIHSGIKLAGFKSLEQGFQLPYALKMELQRSQVLYAPTYRFSLITGVCLRVLSPALIFAAAYVNDDFTPFGVVLQSHITRCIKGSSNHMLGPNFFVCLHSDNRSLHKLHCSLTLS
ncbi:hypothetical protein [Paenibacillus spongiae]|uniref:Uncharacterized protein n=1 Tax=Paenibacillus spongiae TaxID=2909671 RepID=A0ABY5SIS9_9BACL|nr:hypothetical protein [Paenibacillus spongiae]UVI33856.1 hypothetical protein L1F29_03500 [Paenibacillus spongiae]